MLVYDKEANEEKIGRKPHYSTVLTPKQPAKDLLRNAMWYIYIIMSEIHHIFEGGGMMFCEKENQYHGLFIYSIVNSHFGKNNRQ